MYIILTSLQENTTSTPGGNVEGKSEHFGVRDYLKHLNSLSCLYANLHRETSSWFRWAMLYLLVCLTVNCHCCIKLVLYVKFSEGFLWNSKHFQKWPPTHGSKLSSIGVSSSLLLHVFFHLNLWNLWRMDLSFLDNSQTMYTSYSLWPHNITWPTRHLSSNQTLVPSLLNEFHVQSTL